MYQSFLNSLMIHRKSKGKILSLFIAMAFYLLSVTAQRTRHEKMKSVHVGKQEWSGENLETDCFRNGDLIPAARTFKEWSEALKNRKPLCASMDGDPANDSKYGKIYNGYAISDPRGLAS